MEKEINIDEVVKYLSRAFSKAAAKAANSVGSRAYCFVNKDDEWECTSLYFYQVDFSYLIDDIQRGPRYIATKSIQLANELIAQLDAEAG